MDLITSMEIFMRVARSESFSAVAREKDTSQSTISKHIASLENRLNTTLFNRSTRQIKLTETGEEYYSYCAQILNDLKEAESAIGRGQALVTGTLRVSSTATFGRLFILPFLWDFMSEHPQIKVDMILEDRYVDLVKEGVDMAIRVGPLLDSNMVAQKIGESERVIVVSQKYIDKNGEPQTLADLKNFDCITYSLQNSPHEWVFETPSGIECINVGGRFSSTNPESIVEAAKAGLGIAVVMLWSVHQYIEDGSIKVILNDYKPIPLDVSAVYPKREYLPLKVKKLIEHLRISYNKHYPVISIPHGKNQSSN